MKIKRLEPPYDNISLTESGPLHHSYEDVKKMIINIFVNKEKKNVFILLNVLVCKIVFRFIIALLTEPKWKKK